MTDTLTISVQPTTPTGAGGPGDFTGKSGRPCWSIEATLTLAEARVFNRAVLRIGGDVWATVDALPEGPGDDATGRGRLFPLVMFGGTVQLNYQYALLRTFLPGPHVVTFLAAISIEKQVEGAALEMTFTDGTELTAYAPACNVKAPA